MRGPRPAVTLGIAGTLALAALPAALSPYGLILASHALVLAIACLGVNLLFGTAGLLSLGHAAYFGLGAYTGAFLRVFGYVGSFEAYLLSGLLASTALAAVVGLLCARATRLYFSILTLAVAQIVHALFVAGHVFRLAGPVGQGLFFVGEGGLYLPRLPMAGVELSPTHFPLALYYVILSGFLAAMLLMERLLASPFGKALRAIRDNETRARLIGIRVGWHRWTAFVISAAFTALAGALAGELDRQVTPEQLGWLLSAELILVAVVGGSRHLAGPILGAVVVTLLDELASRAAVYHGFVLGALLITSVFLFPGGVAGGLVALAEKARLRGSRTRAVP